MRNDAYVAVAALAVILSASAPAVSHGISAYIPGNAGRTRNSDTVLSGSWTLDVARHTCALTLLPQDQDPGSRRKAHISENCPGELAGISNWQILHGELCLQAGAGNVLARLHLAGDHLWQGRTRNGEWVTITRS